MKAIILAAGEGTRLRPFTVSEPKVMIPVANKPIIEYVVDSLVANRITDILIVVGYKKERIMSYFEDGKDFGAKIIYVTESKQLGTAHALSTAKDYISSDFIVLPGDNIIEPKTVYDLLKEHMKNSALIVESEVPSKYGVVVLSGNIIKNIIEKPEEKISNLISTGIYCFTPQIFEEIENKMAEGKYDLTSVLQGVLPKTKLRGIFSSGIWVDAIYPWDLLSVNAKALTRIKSGISGTLEKNVTLKGPVLIGAGTVIRANSYIMGPAVIGKGCEIGPNVCIYPSTSIGDNVQIAPFSMLKHSIVMNDVLISSSSTILHSVIGEGVKIGSSFSGNSEKATILLEAEMHEIENVGTLIGEDTIIGNGVIATPGSIIGANCKIASQVKIEKAIPNNSIVV